MQRWIIWTRCTTCQSTGGAPSGSSGVTLELSWWDQAGLNAPYRAGGKRECLDDRACAPALDAAGSGGRDRSPTIRPRRSPHDVRLCQVLRSRHRPRTSRGRLHVWTSSRPWSTGAPDPRRAAPSRSAQHRADQGPACQRDAPAVPLADGCRRDMACPSWPICIDGMIRHRSFQTRLTTHRHPCPQPATY